MSHAADWASEMRAESHQLAVREALAILTKVTILSHSCLGVESANFSCKGLSVLVSAGHEVAIAAPQLSHCSGKAAIDSPCTWLSSAGPSETVSCDCRAIVVKAHLRFVSMNLKGNWLICLGFSPTAFSYMGEAAEQMESHIKVNFVK